MGVDLAQLRAEDVASIKDAFWRYAVLIFPDQNLTEDQHVAFAKHFGPIEPTIGAYRPDAKLRLRPDLVDVSNLNSQNEIWGEHSKVRGINIANRLWHTDSSFKYLPARASLSMRTPSHRSEVTPNLPICVPPTMHSPTT